MNTNQGRLTVAVTGVGAIIGQGIIQSLRASNMAIHIIGIDRNPHSPGTYMCDFFEPKPSVSEESTAYCDFWMSIVRKHQIALILPGLELDVAFLNQHRAMFQASGAILALNTPELIDQTRDKWMFGKTLATIGYPVIPSVRTNSWEEAINALGPAPLLLKPLQGNGSRGILILEDANDFEYWRSKLQPPWMLQRIVGCPEQEYTVGVFGLGHGRYVKPIIFRRRLSSAGNTLEAEVVEQNDAIEAAVKQLCTFFTPIGPTNLQFRLDDKTPFLLEINPRFSSSNSLRTAFGFNEAQMAIEYYVHGCTPDTPNIRKGMAWRYSSDFVIYAGSLV